MHSILDRIAGLFWVAVIYLASEVIIWGLSLALAPAKLEFFASILGMLLLFCFMTVVGWLAERSDAIYVRCIRSKVDFINAHLGMGFLIPIVTMGEHDMLHGKDIARITGAFFTTNLVSWPGVFLLSFATLTVFHKLAEWTSRLNKPFAKTTTTLKSLTRKIKNSILHIRRDNRQSLSTETTPANSVMASFISRPREIASVTPDVEKNSQPATSPVWDRLAIFYPTLLSMLCMVAIGLPIAITTGDERALDGFALWFLWITNVRMMRLFKTSPLLASNKRLKSVLVTLCNPVLITTGFMMGYTRGKAAIKGHGQLQMVIETLSKGTPLRSIWTAGVKGTIIDHNPSAYFGAGDLALSLLECGMLVWGFKLYECRRQLFSANGGLTVILCTLAAVGNVFGSVYISKVIGLGQPEVLAFSARCATLALAKPAVQALGGNLVVNAIVVVSNGVLGQLILPFILDRLGVQTTETKTTTEPMLDVSSSETLVGLHPLTQRTSQDSIQEAMDRKRAENDGANDSIMTVAAGVAIGVNGAAMGVSYLYENKSRAAPYAVLSMTVFAIVTVVLTTVDPFKGFVLSLTQA
ncbi:hypothetical protein CDD81_4124 [Ophiocordyceps australis]|uniref:LrgB-like protein n=1 Tax=Ophiocordyceps australis TaxID=1399860 RepID=A0A2C5YAN8_9HYPO|nr:hypothetical protein CDD81_4124 [Ophiocordyceps australis]